MISIHGGGTSHGGFWVCFGLRRLVLVVGLLRLFVGVCKDLYYLGLC